MRCYVCGMKGGKMGLTNKNEIGMTGMGLAIAHENCLPEDVSEIAITGDTPIIQIQGEMTEWIRKEKDLPGKGFEGEVLHKTDKAILVGLSACGGRVYDDGKEEWIPRSQIVWKEISKETHKGQQEKASTLQDLAYKLGQERGAVDPEALKKEAAGEGISEGFVASWLEEQGQNVMEGGHD